MAPKTSGQAQADPLTGVALAHGQADWIHSSSRMSAQLKQIEGIQNSPRMVAQRKLAAGVIGDATQFAGGADEEALLQGEFAAAQRQGPEDEGLEHEAEVMGVRAAQLIGQDGKQNTRPASIPSAPVQPKWMQDSIDKTGRPVRYWTQTDEDSQNRNNAWYLKTESDGVGEEVDANQVHLGGKQFYEKSCTATVFAMMKAAKDPAYRTRLIEDPKFAMVEQERILEDLAGVGVPREWVQQSLSDQMPEKTARQTEYAKSYQSDGTGASADNYLNTLVKEGVFGAEDAPKIVRTAVTLDGAVLKDQAVARWKQAKSISLDQHKKTIEAEANQKLRMDLLPRLIKQVAERGVVHADVGGHSVAIVEAKKPDAQSGETRTRFLVHDPWNDKKAWFFYDELFDSDTLQKRLEMEGVSRGGGIESLILT